VVSWVAISKSVTPQASAKITAECAEEAQRSQRVRAALRPLLRDLCGSTFNSRNFALARSPVWVPAFAGMSGSVGYAFVLFGCFVV